MARAKTLFFCTECGNESPRWEGQCPACRAWNAMVEAPAEKGGRRGSGRRRGVGGASSGPGAAGRGPGAGAALAGAVDPGANGGVGPVRLADVSNQPRPRVPTALEEFDFVLGGGIVPGSLVLLGGEPGIGKSTILLQVAARLEERGASTLYVSGEESAAQVRMRAERLGGEAGRVAFLCETALDRIVAAVDAHEPQVLLVDSIQTMYEPELDAAPGSVSQVRECAARFQQLAKNRGVAVFLVGHVTKDGSVAGPKTLEHVVDTVLYFEGGARLDHRVLRATKNRFGGVDEIGVFRMTGQGLEAVANPSELFLGERSEGATGSAVLASIEGTRPLLVEVQALCATSGYGAAQRVANGFDRQRLALLLAVLEKRAGLAFGDQDVFLNVVGGMRLVEPSADLAVAMAVVSSHRERALPPDAIFVGEIGLSGEVRSVSQLERRLGEASRMGFRHAIVPARGTPKRAPDGLELHAVRNLNEAMELNP